MIGSGPLDVWPCRRGSCSSRGNNWLIEGWPAARNYPVYGFFAQDPTVAGPGKVSQANRPDLTERREEASY